MTLLTKIAAVEYGKHGINAVSPGAVRTEMLLDGFGIEEAPDRKSMAIPWPYRSSEEIADAVRRVVSNEALPTQHGCQLPARDLNNQEPVQPSEHQNFKNP